MTNQPLKVREIAETAALCYSILWDEPAPEVFTQAVPKS